jgi:hypothetical protein
LELYLFGFVYYVLRGELHANGSFAIGVELIFSEAAQNVRFTHSRIPNQNDFVEVIVVLFGLVHQIVVKISQLLTIFALSS